LTAPGRPSGRWQSSLGIAQPSNIRSRGQVPTHADEFDYREYLDRQGVRSIIEYPGVTVLARDQGIAPQAWLASFTGCAFKVRATLTRVIAQTHCVPEPQASLLTGILPGNDPGIPNSYYREPRGLGWPCGFSDRGSVDFFAGTHCVTCANYYAGSSLSLTNTRTPTAR